MGQGSEYQLKKIKKSVPIVKSNSTKFSFQLFLSMLDIKNFLHMGGQGDGQWVSSVQNNEKIPRT